MLSQPPQQLVILSAPSAEQLEQYAHRLLVWIAGQAQQAEQDVTLGRLAYTLQVGRETLRERLALVVGTLSELSQELERWLAGAESRALRGRVPHEGDGVPNADAEAALARGDLEALARHFVAGARPAWARLHASAARPARLALPTVPFLRKRYWLDEPAQGTQAPGPHPLIQHTTRVPTGLLHTTTLHGHETLLRDHALGARKVLPAVAALEMALAAGGLAAGRRIARVENVVWSRPVIVVDEPVELALALQPCAGGWTYELECTGADHGPESCAAGALYVDAEGLDDDEPVDRAALLASCSSVADSDEIYAAFSEAGVSYGASFRTLRRVHYGPQCALARLELPARLEPAFDQCVLHPALMDGVLQAACWVGGALQVDARRSLPFALQRLEIRRPPRPHGYVHARLAAGTSPLVKYDLDLLDEDGRVMVRVMGFTRRAVGSAHALREAAPSDPPAPAMYQQIWSPEPPGGVAAGGGVGQARRLVAVLADEPTLAQALRTRLGAEAEVLWIESATRAAGKPGAHGRVDLDDVTECARCLAALSARAATDGLALALVWQPESGAGDLERPATRLLHLFRAWTAERARRPLRLLILAGSRADDGDDQASTWAPLPALAKTMANEDPGFLAATLHVDVAQPAPELLAALVVDELAAAGHEFQVRLDGRERHVRRWQPLRSRAATTVAPFRDGGTYLVVGGLGALGQAVVTRFGAAGGARFVLMGSRASEIVAPELAALRECGVRVGYVQADLACPGEAAQAVARARAEHGPLHGVLHLAGVLRDGLLSGKSDAEFAQVLAPKLAGTIELDRATRDEPLDFFVLFSSVSAAAGPPGQGDYAYANGFLESFASWRERLRARGQRHGRTLSLLWPAWAEGGMRADARSAAHGLALSGIETLATPQALDLFQGALSQAGDHVLVAPGAPERVRAFLDSTTRRALASEPQASSSPLVAAPSAAPPAAHQDAPKARAEQHLRSVLARTFKLAPEELEAHTPFEAYGIDSILIMDLTRALERDFGSLPKTLFFEYQDLDALAEHFADRHAARLATLAVAPTAVAPPAAPEPDAGTPAHGSTPARAPGSVGDALSDGVLVRPAVVATREPIAIIGLSARFAQADDLEAFWDNLANGRDCIVEIPRERWDWRDYEHASEVDAASRYSRWGSFLADVDKFDALFFGIAPREAEIIDPQERLFLECAWQAIEDAGYTRADLRRLRAGVYAGVMYGLYQLYESERGRLAASSYASIANRVSYTLGLRGPSLALDTMCSSALTALHLACQALRTGEIDVALAGGVNLHVHPYKYRLLGQGQFTSSDGRCRSFGAGGDGYVPGEGVGVFLLKPLSRALRDGDHIHGTILGSALNHGGKTNGYTVPNPVAQGDVITEALAAAGVEADSLSYIEAHGTGTALGDPVELRGLMRAFERAPRAERVPIGSVKSNIGHLESAAGVAGVVKVLLQMKHRTLVPSLHAQTLNANIDWEASPFQVQRERAEWRGPRAADGRVLPLRAGVSSFGAGGANAHLLLEEPPAEPTRPEQASAPQMLVLSAATGERLRVLAGRFVEFLRQQPALELERLAFTLQVGREPLAERLAVVGRSPSDLLAGLAAFLDGVAAPGLRVGSVRAQAAGSGLKRAPHDIDQALRERDLLRLAELWTQGAVLDWRRLYGSLAPRRLALPVYPFERTRCWIDATPTSGRRSQPLHPLLDAVDPARSLDGALTFATRLRADQVLLADHKVAGAAVLPGVALLEMACAALARVAPDQAFQLERVRWLRPVSVGDQPATVYLMLARTQDGIAFELKGDTAEGDVRHAEGLARPAPTEPASIASLVLEQVRARCPRHIDGATLYRDYEQAGLVYGPYLRALESVVGNDDEALGRLVLPDAASAQAYDLHPALMDAALHALGALRRASRPAPMMPYALERVERLRPLPSRAYVHVQRTGVADHYHVTLLDDAGQVCVRLQDLALRGLREPREPRPGLSFAPVWRPVTEPLSAPAAVLRAWLVRAHVDDAWARALIDAHTGDSLEVFEARALAGEEHPGLARESTLPDVVYFVSAAASTQALGDPQALETSQQQGVLALLRLVRRLLARGAGTRPLRLCLLTQEACEVAGTPLRNPWDASLHGFALSLAREHPRWQVTLVDVAGVEAAEAGGAGQVWPRALLSATLAGRGRLLALRGGALYERRFAPLELGAPDRGGLRRGGVYMLIGGAGGIGLELAAWLVRSFDARIMLVGRRALDGDLERRVRAIDPGGERVRYRQADARDPRQLEQVVHASQTFFGALHGVFHAAIVLHDVSLERMDEAALRAALDAKAGVCVALGHALQGLPLDFVAFFSSAVALAGSAGQANYAAGCSFEDAYARALEAQLGVPTKVINWGFWGTVGIVAQEAYRRRLSELGIESISPDEGLDALERVLRHPSPQVLVMKARPDVLTAAGVDFTTGLRWQAREQASCFASLEAVDTRAANRASVLLSERDQQRLDGLVLDWLWQVFQQQGLFVAADERWALPELAQRLGAQTKYERLLAELLRALAGAGYLRGEPDLRSFSVAAPAPRHDAQRELARLSRELPALRGLEPLLRSCLDHLFQVLRGARPATDVLFPQGSMALVEATYRGNPLVDFYNDLVADCVASHVEAALPAVGARPLRILEVGAGTGSTTVAVLRRLAQHGSHLSYCYTDVSRAFLHHGRQQCAGSHAFLEFEVLDITRDVESQGFQPGSYDLVLASNVLHATPDIQASLRHAKALLRPHGWLVLNEVTQTLITATLTFGLLDGWWLYEDASQRLRGAPLLSAEGWRRAAHAAGFTRFRALPGGSQARPTQHVMVAESDGLLPIALGPAREAAQAQHATPGSSSVSPPGPSPLTAQPAASQAPALRAAVEAYVKAAFEQVLHVPAERLWPDDTFETYGVDSLSVPQIVDVLSAGIGPLSTTLLFEQPTLRKLTDHLVQTHGRVLSERLLPASTPAVTPAASEPPQPAAAPAPAVASAGPLLGTAQRAPRRIAIVGLAGRYPQARDLDEFWENLRLGRDCVQEVPATRWDWREHAQVDGAPISRWGGFLDDVDQFDPQFFNMSRREAEFTDPQERLFLETAWRTLEDAGYTRQRLRGSRVGVYVGVMYGHYQLLEAGGQLAGGMGYASIANRVSYFFDFQGPSLAVDSMCSASASAIHLACQALWLDEIDYALAGGVNLSVHPRKYVQLAAGRFTSSDGRCRSFGAGGDGMVPGEGVGAVLLKPLEQAEHDGDRILGVLLGSALNHGGKTSGYSVPNPTAQGSVIEEALRRAGVDAASLGYLEAHGTGTALGDPIEIAGLARALGQGRVARGKLPIGSLKASVGHLESAAGIAGLTKVLLQMRHGLLVPSLHAEPPNPNIDWSSVPFAVQTKLAEWPAEPGSQPRRAGLSAFGAGGANAHLIVEEYPAPPAEAPAAQPRLFVLSARSEPQLRRQAAELARTLAARPAAPTAGAAGATQADERHTYLRALVGALVGVPGERVDLDEPLADLGLDDNAMLRLIEQLRAWQGLDLARAAIGNGLTLRTLFERLPALAGSAPPQGLEQRSLADLEAVACTLQTGREALDERLALVVSDHETLCAELQRFADGAPLSGTVQRGNARGNAALSLILDGDDGRAYVHTLLARRGLAKLAQLWVHGVEFDWSVLYDGRRPRPVSLPGQVFARTRCWLPEPDRAPAVARHETRPEVQAQVLSYRPHWVREPLATNGSPASLLGPVALLAEPAVASGLTALLHTLAGQPPVLLLPGDGCAAVDARTYRLRSAEVSDHRLVLEALGSHGLFPRTVLWVPTPSAPESGANGQALEQSFHGALAFLQALGATQPEAALDLVCLAEEHADLWSCQVGALTGLFQSLSHESARVRARLVHVPAGALRLPAMDDDLGARLATELTRPEAPLEVSLRADGRVVRRWTRLPATSSEDAPRFESQGVYLITGGAGGLGLLFARAIARSAPGVRLALAGRRALDEARLAALDELRGLGADVVYLPADVAVEADVVALLNVVRTRYGRLDGVLHAAGVLHDALLRNKTTAQARAVLAPKVAGVLHLDRHTAADALAFFVTCSSASAVFGAPGQCDYAYGNAFLDRFAEHREALRHQGLRTGRSLSIAWPLWQHGGMAPDAVGRARLAAAGLVPLDERSGVEALLAGLAQASPRLLVLRGEAARIEALVAGQSQGARRHDVPPVRAEAEAAAGPSWVEEQIAGAVAALTGYTPQELDPERSFEAHGLDSVALTKLAHALGQRLGLEISPALFFEATTMRRLAQHLAARHAQTREARPRPAPSAARPRPAVRPNATRSAAREHGPVAIIGMAGSLPGASDLERFWQRLQDGDTLVTEVPAARWDGPAAQAEPEQPGVGARVRRGGFLPRVDAFDALFFGISPREADWMDPQQRLLLQTVWAALEDAGLDPGSLAGSDTGLFVGVGPSEYADLVHRSGLQADVHAATGLTASMLVNRVSYQLDLHGPSEPVDTACSSSFVALHHALQAIEQGRCRVALAGGVNLLLSPLGFVTLERAGMLSPDGVGRAFDRRANGYVRGEGVGVVVLKALDDALADGDPIHALVLGSAVNHGGRASSLTAPNPEAQARVVIAACERAGVDPGTIGCIETHGTGTVLGDPVEVRGLRAAFAELYERWGRPAADQPHCALLALKNSIGHLEPAAGIAALLRAVLALRHARLIGTANAEEPNPHLELQGTPFHVLRETRDWPAQLDASGAPIPRRVGLSSFGYGGVNAHVVIEEYQAPAAPAPTPQQRALILVLSARRPDRLRAYVEQFLRPEWRARWTADVVATVFTLQTGRPEFEERLAVVGRDADELLAGLHAYLAGNTELVYVGRARPGRGAPEQVSEEASPHTIAARWVQGARVDWRRVAPQSARRCSLPTYPFAPERCWFTRASEGANPTAGGADTSPTVPALAPAPAAAGAELVCFRPVWKAGYEPQVENTAPALLFVGQRDLVPSAATRESVLVLPGREFRSLGPRLFEIDPRAPQDYGRLLAALESSAFSLTRVAHLWALQPVGDFPEARGESLTDRLIARGPGSLLLLLQALASGASRALRRLLVATDEDALPGGLALAEALGGVGASLATLMPDVSCSTLRFAGAPQAEWGRRCLAELQAGQAAVARYVDGARHVQHLEALTIAPRPAAALRQGGVYLLAGGGGALGLWLAEFLARRCAARLALLGRSPLTADKRARLEALSSLGAAFSTHQASVEDLAQVRDVMAQVKARWGRLDGVFHLAGAPGRGALTAKSPEDFRTALRARVDGALNLDEATRDEALDLFVLYSSTAAYLGDFGLLDYTLGQRFLDGFAAEREALRARGERHGRSLSIAWPLWRAGGMHVDAEQERRYLASTGLAYLESQQAEQALEWALAGDETRALVMFGARRRVLALAAAAQRDERDSAQVTVPSPARSLRGLDETTLEVRLQAEIAAMLAAILGLEPRALASDVGWGDYGLDSFGIKAFSAQLGERFGIDLPATRLFGVHTLEALASLLKSEFGDALRRAYAAPTEPVRAEPPSAAAPARVVRTAEAGGSDAAAIAVIGMSARLPGSPDLAALWQHLEQGHDLIEEVPAERWDWRAVAARYPGTPRWGGFISGVADFDAPFFRISPLEARVLDPQQRLFLQECWRALEHAGCRADRLAGRPVGVFVGVQFGDYEALVVETGETNAYAGTGLAKTMLANRVSYLLDLRGPSESIDSACSSSLVALHRAVRSLRAGESELAIAGGVSLMLSARTFVSAHSLGVLSPEGRCKTLDRSANGYVKGEGVAALVLKPLARALADGDPIQAVIRGSAVCHGGRAHALTAPNPGAQADLLVAAYRDAGVPLSSVSYLELHGTGTELGDPIEVDGIVQAWQRSSDPAQRVRRCALGTVKSNLGHLEPAAGVAGVVKTVLALQQRQIPASLHVRELNPQIRLAGTPFVPATETHAWQALDEQGQPLPRRAGVSSFGFGGVNAHVVLEEYLPAPVVVSAAGPQLFVLSARDEARLRDYAVALIAFVRRTRPDLAALARTFQLGRVPLPARLALVVRDCDTLCQALEGHLRGESSGVVVACGNAQPEAVGCVGLDGDAGHEYVELLAQRGDLERLARLWVSGLDIDWQALPTAAGARISAPTYPFAAERHWIDVPSVAAAPAATPAPSEQALRLLTKVWQAERGSVLTTEAPPPLPAGPVLVLASAETEALARALFAGEPQVQAHVQVLDGQGSYAPPEPLDPWVGLVDLCDLTEADHEEPCHDPGRFALYQALVRAWRNRTPFWLHFTRGLRPVEGPCTNLAGATVAALVGMLSAEYKGLRALTLDLEREALNAATLRHLLARELHAQRRSTEVADRRGVRYLPAFEDVPEPARSEPAPCWFGALREQLVVISGGTRGLGLAVARELIERGARRLLLMGRRALPPVGDWPALIEDPATERDLVERLRPLSELLRPGLELRVHSGRLDDRVGLAEALARVRHELGPVAGVVHCAGFSSLANPAFIDKAPDEFERVLEPKLAGLLALHAACAADEPRFFVMFSSVSAQVPALAAGLSDYAVANAFMDHFAAFQAGRGRPSVRALQWPSWRSMGMPEVRGQAYHALGLRTLASDVGLRLMQRALAIEGVPSVMPCLVDVAGFDPARLLQWPGRVTSAATSVTGSVTTAAEVPVQATTLHWLTELFAQVLRTPAARLPADTNLAEFGVDSILIAQLLKRLEAELAVQLDPSVFLESSSLGRLARRLEQDHFEALRAHLDNQAAPAAEVAAEPSGPPVVSVLPASVAAPASTASTASEPVAVIGLACHFPGAPDKHAFWRNLAAGRSAIGEVPRSRWDVARLYSAEYEQGRSISRWGGFLEAIEDFDAEFFRIDPALAAHIDPLIRQVLEVSTECVQDAGLERAELAGRRVAVMVGGRTSNFGYYNRGLRSDSISGLAQNFIAAHVAQFLDLRGPNLVVDSACSSSLVSVHLACQSLRTGESELALAGGVEILLDEVPFVGMSEGRALSPTGRCHVFDAKADGIVLGEGAGMLLLKRLGDALRDGDRIYAVIEASAVNNDGRTMGITTPNPEAQRRVIEEALRAGGLNASAVTYVEAHGTGTMIGDPIELKALTEVFRRNTAARRFCGVGSVKTNIGHLLSAAGIAGLVKVLLAIEHGQLPPTLNCETLNPRFRFDESPFYPVRQLERWVGAGGVRRAGLSSFGFGGTNAHLIVSAGAAAWRAAYRPTRPVLAPVSYRRRRCWFDNARPALDASETRAPRPLANGRDEQAPRPVLELCFQDGGAA